MHEVSAPPHAFSRLLTFFHFAFVDPRLAGNFVADTASKSRGIHRSGHIQLISPAFLIRAWYVSRARTPVRRAGLSEPFHLETLTKPLRRIRIA